MDSDFELLIDDSVVLLWPATERAESWCFFHLPRDCPRIGTNYVIETKHARPILERIMNERLTLGGITTNVRVGDRGR